jgi:16S rRNA (uracil1498-N3)-methyltransferase
MIGPEGGFTPGELREAEKRGFLKAGMGRRILKSETASIVGATLLQFLAGDL